MINLSEAQILAWITPLLWPFLRALALLATVPVFSQRAVPMRVKIGIALNSARMRMNGQISGVIHAIRSASVKVIMARRGRLPCPAQPTAPGMLSSMPRR